ncbi:hypothetical protein HYV80_03795 [Candidatus Woesearchaeota archaeon]|nr:hypothetical protein [Candidatus Woesearchaeota archaeon]
MAETLIERIRTIEAIPNYVTVDKDTEIRKAFEELGQSNRVVRAVMDGKTTFLAEYNKSIGPYDHDMLFSLNSLPEDFQQQVQDLEQALGDTRLANPAFEDVPIANYMTRNPIKSGLALGGIVGGGLLLIPDGKDYNQKVSRRGFILSSIGLVGSTAALGAVLGMASLAGISNNLRQVRENALYLDTTFRRAYSR